MKSLTSPSAGSREGCVASKLTTGPRGLEQRVVCAAENSLGLVQRINLVRPGRLASFVVLQQPIAFTMERRDVLGSEHCFLRTRVTSLRVSLQRRIRVSLSCPLLRQRLRITCTLVGRIFHQLLVIGLRILLLRPRPHQTSLLYKMTEKLDV